MPNSAKVTLTLTDDSFSPSNSITGITGFLGQFDRGPVGKTSDVFSSWNQFKKIYGGLSSTSDGPLLVKRMLDRGVNVRVCNVRHYTSITDPTTLSTVVPTYLPTKVYTLSAALVTGQVLSFTMGGITVTQAFVTDSPTSLALWGAKIVAAFSTVDSYYVVSGTVIQIVLLSGSATLVTTGSGTLPTFATTTLAAAFSAGGTKLFDLIPKYGGAAYNNLKISVLPASNGQAAYFNIKIELTSEPDFTPEVYQNLIIPGSPTVQQSTYLNDIVLGSSLVNVVYADLSGIVSLPIVPVINYSRYSGGSDGGAVVAIDYAGDSGAKNGYHTFDGVYDILAMGTDSQLTAIAQSGSSYADARGDLQFLFHFDNALTDGNSLVAAKQALNIDTKYVEFWTGGVNVIDPLTGNPRNISGIADILTAASLSESQFGAWWSFAGVNRGMLKNILGVVNNFAAASDSSILDLLANNQINALVSDGDLHLSGNFSGQLANSTLSFNSIVRLTCFLKKQLRGIVKPFLEEPNDIPTWKNMYLKVRPFLNTLAGKRAFQGKEGVGWSWNGDQFATDLSKLVINNETDVENGIYKVNVFFVPVNSLQQIGVNMVVTNSTVSFEDAVSTPSA